jgi:hypothetical protein
VFSTHQQIDPSIIADCLGAASGEFSVHRTHEDIADWVRHQSEARRNDVRLLAICEHNLTTIAKRAALAAGVSPNRVKTRTYWKPGRRGLE